MLEKIMYFFRILLFIISIPILLIIGFVLAYYQSKFDKELEENLGRSIGDV